MRRSAGKSQHIAASTMPGAAGGDSVQVSRQKHIIPRRIAPATLIEYGPSEAGEQATCKAVRDAGVEALSDEVTMTISEIDGQLADDDPRWEVFGLNIPANPTAPEAVTTLTITPAGTGRELVEWPCARRANYYRVFLKRIGTDSAFVNVDDAGDLDFVLKNLTPGATIEVYLDLLVAHFRHSCINHQPPPPNPVKNLQLCRLYGYA